MNKRFTENEVRAYSKNRFEDRALRHRLEKLREELIVYHDTTAKYRMGLIEESKDLRKTSGGSPVPAELVDQDEDISIDSRLRRPWAYSVMETTYNSMYRDADILTTRKCKRPRAKSAVTITLYNSSSVNTDGEYSRNCMTEPTRLARTSQSAKQADIATFGHQVKSDMFNKDSTEGQITHRVTIDEDEVSLSEGLNESSKQMNLSEIQNVTDSNSRDNTEYVIEKTESIFSDRIVDTRPYARVLSLPPAYTIDSKDYQEAERSRLINRSRSRVSFSSTSGVATVANTTEVSQSKDKQAKPPDKHETAGETKDNDKTCETNNSQEDTCVSKVENSKNRNALRANKNVQFRGHVIKNYIRPEDRYKLDPSILNRRQKRMDRLAQESTTYLKRINHENIKVEIAFPRSARKRLLTRLVQENNSSKKKTFTNNETPVIKTKVERFMVSISDYIEKQRVERSMSFIY